MKRHRHHYVDNRRLEELILEWQAGDATHVDELVENLRLIAENLSRTYGGRDPDEAVQAAMVACWEAVPKFVTGKGAGFNFMSTVGINAMRQIHRSAKCHLRCVAAAVELLR